MSTPPGHKIGFELFEHTADIGVNVFGNSVSDIFEQSARSMYSILFHNQVPKVELKGEFQIKLKSSDLEQLLVDWLDELLFIYSTEKILINDFQLDLDLDNFTLEARIKGEQLTDEQLRETIEIKAVTYHMLEIKKTIDSWTATIIFDI
jgi:SHS2 domain-containing protein